MPVKLLFQCIDADEAAVTASSDRCFSQQTWARRIWILCERAKWFIHAIIRWQTRFFVQATYGDQMRSPLHQNHQPLISLLILMDLHPTHYQSLCVIWKSTGEYSTKLRWKCVNLWSQARCGCSCHWHTTTALVLKLVTTAVYDKSPLDVHGPHGRNELLGVDF